MAHLPVTPTRMPARIVFRADSPYTAVRWPQIPAAEHDIMLEMLVNLLVPIGRHRSMHITPSKGKRSKKRKRHDGRTEPHAAPAPPMPEIASHITVGVNSTTRHLEQLAAQTAPPVLRSHVTKDRTTAPSSGSRDDAAALPEKARNQAVAPSEKTHDDAAAPSGNGNENDSKKRASHALPSLSLIFTFHPPSSAVTSHLPLLSFTSSSIPFPATTPPSASISTHPTLLIPLKPSAESKVAAALGVSRASVIGLTENVPGAGPLLEYARGCVQPVDVPWVREAREARYLEVNVLAVGAGTKAGTG